MGITNKFDKPLTILLFLVIALIILYFAPGVVKSLFDIGREFGHAIGDVLFK